MDASGAFVNVHITRSSFRVGGTTFSESLVTDTSISGDATAGSRQIEALAIAANLMAGGVSTIIELDRTAYALVVGRTDTVERAEGVQTSSAILTAQLGSLVMVALVYILFAVGALVCCRDKNSDIENINICKKMLPESRWDNDKCSCQSRLHTLRHSGRDSPVCTRSS